MKYGKVGVLLGGISSEREISIKSGKAIASGLRRKGLDVVEIGEQEDIEEGVKKNKIDVAFIALHGQYGEDGKVQAFLEKAQIPYTGSEEKASNIALDKIKTKEMLIRNKILVPGYVVLERDKQREVDLKELEIKVPLVIKPATEGSSVGLSIVFREGDFKSCLNEAYKYSQRILVEEYIKGEELTVGILGEETLPVIRIIPKNEFYNFDAKYTKGKTDYIVPADMDHKLSKKVQAVAKQSYKAVGCRDFSRVDIILEEPSNKIYVLEINTIPGFTETSLLPKAAQAWGIEFDDLCLRILDMALSRRQNKRSKV